MATKSLQKETRGSRAARAPRTRSSQSVILRFSTGGYDVVSLCIWCPTEVVWHAWSPWGAARAPLAIEAIAGHTTVNEIVRAYEIRSLQTVEWKSQTLAHLPEVLSDRWRAVI